MADETPVETLDSAEKAYAAAAEAVTEAPVVVVTEPDTAKPDAKAAKVAKPVKVAAAPAKAPAKAKKPVAAKIVLAKPAKAVKATKPAPAPKPSKAKPVAKKTAAKSGSTLSQIKDTIMTKAKSTDFVGTIKGAFAEAQTKAKDAYAKGTAAVTEAGEFAKGNVEAVVESGKILSEGFKTLGTDYVAEGKKAFETMTADAKELAAVKSPADFFKLQSDILRRNFDAAVALSTKNTEAAFKLANDAFAPISGRVSLAVAKVKQAA